MPVKNNTLSMIILAGGASSRMGMDKSDLIYKGKTFLEYQIEKGRQLGIEDIVVSGYRGKNCGVPVIKDREESKGPLGGLEVCMRQIRYDTCLVLGVDVPLVPTAELERLIQAARCSGKDAVILQHGEKQEPLIGIYKTSVADAMLEEIHQYKGSVFAFLRRLGYEVYESQAEDALFSNINTPQLYEWLRNVNKV